MKTKIKKILGIVLSLVMVFGIITITNTDKTIAQEDGYVIENTSGNPITVTIKHMLNQTTSLYADDVKEVPAYSTINNYKKAVNYDVASVYVDSKRVDNVNHINLTSTSSVTVYYTAVTQTVNRAVSFYDYVVRPGKEETEENKAKSINYIGNYRDANGNEVKDTSNNFTVGNFNVGNGNVQTYASQKSMAKTEDGLYVNAWDTSWHSDAQIRPSTQGTPHILKGLSKDYKNVEFYVNDPGVFTDSSVIRAGKTNIDNYKLQLKQTGDTFELVNVLNEKNEKTLENDLSEGNSSNFYPLNKSASNTTDYGWNNDGKGNNYYFGMRYDVEFKVGDYAGALNYTFSGDDDLWVLLDGNVILDLGGIHNAITKTVDVKAAITSLNLDVNKSHRLTVLYMERGGNVSNCYMKFTLPNATFIDVSNTPKTSIEINKVSSVDSSVLQGAEFTLTSDTNSTDVRRATSDANGKVTFDNLVAGTYTLVETVAPTGFVKSDKTYKVIVTVENDQAVARLYESDGTTEITNKTISNESNLTNILDYNKSVKLVNWEDRTYQITLDAASKAESTSTSTTVLEADMMLVLDRSGSMANSTGSTYVEKGIFKDVKLSTNKTYYCVIDEEYKEVKYHNPWSWYDDGYWYIQNGYSQTKLDSNSEIMIYEEKSTSAKNGSFMNDLKIAANGFIDSIASQSPNSRIGVASFASNYQEVILATLDASLQSVGGNSTTLKNAINSLYAKGGTTPDAGLKLAQSEFSNSQSNTPKYVVLFTDGKPTGNGSEWDDTYADAAKDVADKLKEAGVKVYTIGFNLGGANTKTAKWLRDDIASEGCALTADSMDELTSVFNKISQDVTKGAAISGATIKDVIDPRFTITDDEKVRLENLGATVTESNGQFTVTWPNQEIPYDKDGVQGTSKWTQVINVVAKDSFVGDNNVTTNGADSGITVDGLGEVKFSQPTVNVRVDLTINNVKDTRFKGEEVDPTEYTNDFAVKNNYDKSQVDPSDLTFESTDKITSDKQLKVTAHYEVSSPTVESNANSTIGDTTYKNENIVAKNDGSNGFENELGKEYGILDIKFVAGELKITKTIDKQYSDKEVISANQSFVFRIDRYSDPQCTDLKETFYEVISFDANDKDIKTKFATITGLSKGYYKVTEEGSWSDKYDQVSAVDTDEDTSDQIIGIGERKVESGEYFGQIGHKYEANITFTNNKNNRGWLSDGSIAINKLTK